MRYYVYLSETKLDMLHPQIAAPTRVTTREVGVDIRVVKSSRKTEQSAERSSYDRLQQVEDWIYANERVGSVEEPEAWIYGHLSLSMSYFTDGQHPTPRDIDRGAVLFAGSGEKNALVLGGTGSHLVTARQPENPSSGFLGYSNAVFLMRTLRAFHADVGDFNGSAGRHPEDLFSRELSRDLAVVHRRLTADNSNGVPLGTCEFLAKNLMRFDQNKGGSLILATPLFVALDS
jgi:hypothetical protein